MRIAKVLPVSCFTVTVLSSGIKASIPADYSVSVCIQRRAVICNAFQGQLSQVPDRVPGGWPRPSIHLQLPLMMMECTRGRLASVDLVPTQDFACVSQQSFRHLAMSLQAGRYAVTSTSAPCAMPAVVSHPDVDAWPHTFTLDILW